MRVGEVQARHFALVGLQVMPSTGNPSFEQWLAQAEMPEVVGFDALGLSNSRAKQTVPSPLEKAEAAAPRGGSVENQPFLPSHRLNDITLADNFLVKVCSRYNPEPAEVRPDRAKQPVAQLVLANQGRLRGADFCPSATETASQHVVIFQISRNEAPIPQASKPIPTEMGAFNVEPNEAHEVSAKETGLNFSLPQECDAQAISVAITEDGEQLHILAGLPQLNVEEEHKLREVVETLTREAGFQMGSLVINGTNIHFVQRRS